jgi:hypothetical protein
MQLIKRSRPWFTTPNVSVILYFSLFLSVSDLAGSRIPMGPDREIGFLSKRERYELESVKDQRGSIVFLTTALEPDLEMLTPGAERCTIVGRYRKKSSNLKYLKCY